MHNCGIVEKERNGEKVICSIALESINNLVDDVRDVSGDVC